MKFPVFFTLFFMSLTATWPATAQTVEIQGFVKTAEGQAIANVYIEDGEIFTDPETDEEGYFRFSSRDAFRYIKTLVFDKKGFVPKIVPVDRYKTKLDVVLEPEKNKDLWEIPTCNFPNSNRYKVVGTYLKLFIPKKMSVKSGVDSDYIYYSVGFKKGKNEYRLNGGLGNLYGSPYPSDRLRSEVRNFSYRRTSVGIDWRGTTKEGKYWRYFGAISAFESYHYETESREVAEVFDRILDRVCFRAKK